MAAAHHQFHMSAQGWGLRVDFRQLAKEPHLVREALARVLSEPSFASAAQQKSVLMQAHSRSPRQRTAGGRSSASVWVVGSVGGYNRSISACRGRYLLSST